MSAYFSMSPVLERTAAENASARPDAPQVPESGSPGRLRLAAAAVLRRAAGAQVAIAARLERPRHRVAIA